ncbi:MAG: hypothetical protein FWC77_00355 [Defluviitaleaceae bacterium]|nr:hypothetical protein [Defluviitaleaceae bacterium]
MSTQTRKDVLEEKQCVILKGRRDGISILLDDKTDFNIIKDVLRKRVAGSRNFFEGADTTVNFKGRKLSSSEEKMLLDIIQLEANLNISVADDTSVIEPPTEPEPKLIPASPPGMLPTEMETFYYRGAVRSGQIVRQNSSIVIVGDVNPGAEIKATGNIIVLGSLKGTAWAGAPGSTGGDINCFVAALDFQPTQIRIAHVVTYIPEDSSQVPRGKGAWAYIQEGAVYIAPL